MATPKTLSLLSFSLEARMLAAGILLALGASGCCMGGSSAPPAPILPATPVGFPADLKMNFESTVAALSDPTGKLLFCSNGCRIADADGQVLLDGDGLNPGEVRDSACPKNGYIAPRGALFLPKPGAEKFPPSLRPR